MLKGYTFKEGLGAPVLEVCPDVHVQLPILSFPENDFTEEKSIADNASSDIST